jgi:hypothetical protein
LVIKDSSPWEERSDDLVSFCQEWEKDLETTGLWHFLAFFLTSREFITKEIVSECKEEIHTKKGLS